MENIQVCIRERPQHQSEIEADDPTTWQIARADTIQLSPDRQSELIKSKKLGLGHRTKFTYNRCFDKSQTTLQIYDSIIKRIALSSLQGINGTVFMYGQTGSGKTFTMMGPKGDNEPFQAQLLLTMQSPRGRDHSAEKVFFGGKQSPVDLDKAKTNRNRSRSPIAFQEKSLTPTASQARRTNTATPTKFDFQIKKEALAPKNEGDEVKVSQFSHRRAVTTNVQQTTRGPQAENAVPIDPDNATGVLALAVKDIFTEIDKQPEKKFFLKCSYLEIYNDLVYDLLNPQNKLSETLSINEDQNKEFYIKGAIEEIVTSYEEILDRIKRGEINRHYASTMMNHSSSRSHTLFRLYVQSIPSACSNENENVFTESILNFVDLAGSEKLEVHDGLRAKSRENSLNINLNTPSNAGTQLKERTKESQHINKSLFFLTQVISMKAKESSDAFIPYRNSPLTKILRSSLGGNSRTAIILCINPCLSQFEQTLSTLRFGLNAKKIENKIQANVHVKGNDESLKALIREYELKIKGFELERELQKGKEKSKSKSSSSEEMLETIKKLQEQKNILAERLLLAQKSHNFSGENNFVDFTKKGQVRWEHCHFKNVGILHVLTDKTETKTCSCQNAAQDNAFNKEKPKMVRKNDTAEAKLTRKKHRYRTLKHKLQVQSLENSRMRQILMLYHNQNEDGLKRLSLESIDKLERNLHRFLDTLKCQKALKLLSRKLSTNKGANASEYRHMLSQISAAELTQGYAASKHETFYDVDFEEEFFTLDPNIAESMKSDDSMLGTMNKDTNLFGSFAGSLDPKISLDMNTEKDLQSSIGPQIEHVESFQNYLSTTAFKKDKQAFLKSQEQENAEFKIAKPKEGAQKPTVSSTTTTNRVPSDRYQVSHTSTPQEDSEKEIGESGRSTKHRSMTSPVNYNAFSEKICQIKGTARNLNEEMKLAGHLSTGNSSENIENIGSLNNLEISVKRSEDKGIRGHKSQKTEVDLSKLGPDFKPKYACLNL